MRSGSFDWYADENIEGALVRALSKMGWNILRGIDVHPAGTPDEVHFAEAARLGMLLLSHDSDMLGIAVQWQEQGREFPGVVFLAPRKYKEIRAMLRALRACRSRFDSEPPKSRVFFA